MKTLISRILAMAALTVTTVAMTGCGSKSQLSRISDICGIEVSDGKIVSEKDTHGGFHGDGERLVTITFKDSSVAAEIAENPNWHELPMTDAVAEAADLTGDPDMTIPQVGNGYWFFCDRHFESRDRYDTSALHGRYSYNFTIMVYDADSDTLYMYELDT